MPGAALVLILVASAAQDDAPSWERDVRPFLAAHCARCHDAEKRKGGLDLAAFGDEASARAALDVFEEARVRVLDGIMPPEDEPRPPDASRRAFVAWIDAALADDARASGGGAAAFAHLRRLSRFEHRNTLRDLFGIDADVSAFPPDEVAHGFENIGAGQGFSPLALEKQLAAAEEIAARAIALARGSERRRFEAEALVPRGREFRVHEGVRMLHTEGAVEARVAVGRAGAYAVRVAAGAEQAGPERAALALRAGDRELARVEIAAELPATEVHERTVTLDAGDARIAAAFVNDFYEKAEGDRPQRDRNLGVAWIEIEGPLDAPLPRGLLAPLLAAPDAAAFRAALDALVLRVWRRPAERAELDALLALAPADASNAERLERALVAMLVSPHYLLRVELDPPDAGASPHALSAHELATRLSYFLWSSAPDERLLALAATGELLRPERLRAEAERMLADARASALVQGFFVPWLGLRRIDQVTPDATLHPEADAELVAAMRAETELFLEALLYEDRPVDALVRGDFTFVNERLARHYGLPEARGERMRRVSLGASARAGLLTHASILTLTSNPTRTSPVKRGKWILETLLGTPPDPPPPGVGVLADDEASSRAASVRERLALHRAQPDCAACHAALDPLGLALEHFGPTGRWRDEDHGHAIDASAELPDGARIDGARGLAERLAEGERLERALAERLLVYALGRELVRADRRTADAVLEAARTPVITVRSLLLAVTGAEAFRTRRAERAPE